MRSLLIGLGLGFLVALQLGPMSLLLIRSTLRDGVRVGLAIGAGVAVIDTLYAALGVLGAAPLLRIGPSRWLLGAAGTAVLVWMGLRHLASAVHVHAGLEGESDVGDPHRAFRTSLGATASNPLTIASWAGIFAAASTGTTASAVPLVLGVGIGSATWVSLLACGVAAARRTVGPRAGALADYIAGLGLLGFAAGLGWHTVHDA